ncbi:MAG: serine protease [Bacteriovoracaceae bacterium]|nr:serine protease [Bacteriovoracaceae bacterium]
MKKKMWIVSLLSLQFLILVGSCAHAPQANQTHQEEHEIPMPPLLPKQNHDTLPPQVGQILKLTKDKVYQILVKRPKELYVTYDRELPYDLLPFEMRNSDYVSIGSAFSLAPKKFLTCAHVFGLHTRSYPEDFYLKDAMDKIYKVHMITKYSVHHDIAEFTLENNIELPLINIAKQTPEIGDPVYSVGNALGFGISVRGGIMSSLTPETEFGEWKNIRFSAAASPGNSGGPLVNERGEVIGIIQAKSSSENLNYSYPISELGRLPENAALVKQKMQYSPYGQRELYTAEFKLKLPQESIELQRNLSKKFREESDEKAKDFFHKHEKKFFYQDPQVNKYLRFQLVGKFWNKIAKQKNEEWGNYTPEYRSERFDQNEELTYGLTGNNEATSVFYGHFVYRHADNVSLAGLWENPAPAITRILNMVTGPIKLSDVTLKVTNLNRPEETEFYEDQLHRYWRIDTWRLRSIGTSLVSACLPHPKGLACHFLAPMTADLEVYGGTSLLKYELGSWMISLAGQLKEWTEFLQLPKKFTSAWSDLQIDQNEKGNWSMATNTFKFQHEFPPIFNRIEVSLETGYDFSLPLKQRIVGLGFYDGFGESNFTLLPHLRPQDNAKEEEKVLWKQTVLKESSYAEEVAREKNEKKMVYVWQKNGEGKLIHLNANVSSLKLPVIYRSFCYTDTHHPDENVKNWCNNFGKAFTITDGL